MYRIDEQDSVIPVRGLPPSDVGAPMPFVVADENYVLVAYIKRVIGPSFAGTNPRLVEPSMSEPYVFVGFRSDAHMFGYPNDEALCGHPLYKRGLKSYGSFEVVNSSWIRQISKMNQVCFPQRPELFDGLRHYILTFHDSMFECVASGVELRGERTGTRREIMAHMSDLLHESE